MEGKGEGGLRPQERRNFRKRFPLFFVIEEIRIARNMYVQRIGIDILFFGIFVNLASVV